MHRKYAFVAVWIVVVLALCGPLAAQTRNGNGEEAVAAPSKLESKDAITEVLNYWTKERFDQAKPMPMPAPRTGEHQTRGTTAPAPSNLPLVADSGVPGDTPSERREPLRNGTEGFEGEWGTTPFSYTRYRLFPDNNTLATTFPYRTVGKMFFTIPGQGNYVCSASSLNSSNRSVVWTAGHCVYSPGVGWHTNVVFVPARRAGANPYGVWTANQTWTLGGWLSGFLEYDMGALVMNRGGTSNLHIGNAVGWLGFVADAARQQHWHISGYPAAPRDLASTPPGAQFDGEHLELCAAAWATNDRGANGPPTMGVGCDQTGGTSGGPWTLDFSGVGGATNLLNSNASYRYVGGPPNNLRLYGPYFTTGAINLRNAAQSVPIP